MDSSGPINPIASAGLVANLLLRVRSAGSSKPKKHGNREGHRAMFLGLSERQREGQKERVKWRRLPALSRLTRGAAAWHGVCRGRWEWATLLAAGTGARWPRSGGGTHPPLAKCCSAEIYRGHLNVTEGPSRDQGALPSPHIPFQVSHGAVSAGQARAQTPPQAPPPCSQQVLLSPTRTPCVPWLSFPLPSASV